MTPHRRLRVAPKRRDPVAVNRLVRLLIAQAQADAKREEVTRKVTDANEAGHE